MEVVVEELGCSVRPGVRELPDLQGSRRSVPHCATTWAVTAHDSCLLPSGGLNLSIEMEGKYGKYGKYLFYLAIASLSTP